MHFIGQPRLVIMVVMGVFMRQHGVVVALPGEQAPGGEGEDHPGFDLRDAMGVMIISLLCPETDAGDVLIPILILALTPRTPLPWGEGDYLFPHPGPLSKGEGVLVREGVY